MFEDSAAEHLRSISKRLYSDNPKGSVLEGKRGKSAFGTTAERVADLLTQVGKISALLALPVGIVVLLSYLGDETAPLPSIDASITILLSLVSVAFLFITFMGLSAFLFPFYRRFEGGFQWQKKIYLSEARRQHASRHKSLPKLIANYLSEFGHFAVTVCAVSVLFCGHEWCALAILVTGLVFWSFYAALPKLRGAAMRKRTKGEIGGEMLTDFGSSLMSYFGVICPLVYVVAKRGIPSGHYAWMVMIVFGVPLLIHALCFVLVTGWSTALMMYCFLVFIMVMLGPGLPFLGGATLSLLGLGGNIPVSMIVKTYGRAGAASGTEELTGCLVIMTAADVIVRPTARRSECNLHPSWWFNRMKNKEWRSYTNVDRYPRADILRISAFPIGCGTVDGLPDPACNDAGKK